MDDALLGRNKSPGPELDKAVRLRASMLETDVDLAAALTRLEGLLADGDDDTTYTAGFGLDLDGTSYGCSSEIEVTLADLDGLTAEKILESDQFQRSRHVPNACRDCPHVASCGGGCASRRTGRWPFCL